MALRNAFENLAVESKQDVNNELVEMLQYGLTEIVRQLQSIRNDGGMADAVGRVRTVVEGGSMSTISTVSNIGAIGGYSMQQMAFSITNVAAQNLRSKITVS